MNDEVSWGEPPPTARPTARRWGPTLEVLSEVPGQWVRFPFPVNRSWASRLRNGKVAGVDPANFEFKNSPGTEPMCTLWVRWVGEETA